MAIFASDSGFSGSLNFFGLLFCYRLVTAFDSCGMDGFSVLGQQVVDLVGSSGSAGSSSTISTSMGLDLDFSSFVVEVKCVLCFGIAYYSLNELVCARLLLLSGTSEFSSLSVYWE